METRSQQTNADIVALLKSRHTLLWVVSREEMRVEAALIDAATSVGYKVEFWDCAAGITDISGESIDSGGDPNRALRRCEDISERTLLVMRDLHRWFDPVVLRTLRNLARSLQGAPREKAATILILSPTSEIPPELAGHTTVIDYPLPERPEMERILADTLSAIPEEMRNGDDSDAIVDAALGLTADEAANTFAKSLVIERRVDPVRVGREKKTVIARERVLSWTDPDPRGLDAVGGLDNLKAWLRRRRSAFSQDARAFGIPAPKGVMLVGVPGCGKSLTAKAVASAWSMPLLRLDLGGLRSKYVGESEGNIRKALSVAETVAPCVLWLDEIEKALAAGTGGAADGGVSADALGTILSWMQERTASVFVVATANDVSALPPELLRKGRFDEMFFVDLPTRVEAAEILNASIRQHGHDPDAIPGLDRVLAHTHQFTGAEVSAIVPEALFEAFDSQTDLTAELLIDAANTVTPLAKTAEDKLTKLREWAKGRCRHATARPQTDDTKGAGRDLDL